MRPISVLCLLALLITIITPPAVAQTFHVNFDTAPDGTAITNGTVVNTLYASWGVTFEAVRCDQCIPDPNVYANSNCLIDGPISAPNVVTLFGGGACSDISEAGHGVIQATFAKAVDYVCIQVRHVRPTDSGVLHLYDSRGREIASASSGPGPTGVVYGICRQGRGIKRVTFSGSGTSFAWFDDLMFQIPVEADSDEDGVFDGDDQCPETPIGAIVNGQGCSIEQLAPCAATQSGAAWRNHGQYVSAVAKAAQAFVNLGLISAERKRAIVSAAARSDCGTQSRGMRSVKPRMTSRPALAPVKRRVP